MNNGSNGKSNRPIPEAAEVLLWRLAGGGDLEARNHLLLVHRGIICKAARRTPWGVHEWADLESEAMVAAIDRLPRWQPGRGWSLANYLFRSVIHHLSTLRRAALAERRRAEVQAAGGDNEAAWFVLRITPDHREPTTETILDGRTAAAALARLPNKYRHVLEWRYQDEWTMEQIGSELGFSRQRAEQVIGLALEELRQMIHVKQEGGAGRPRWQPRKGQDGC